MGWVVIGETCLDKQHMPTNLYVKKTYILPTGQPTILKPCSNQFDLRENYSKVTDPACKALGELRSSIFEQTKNDDKPGLSYEDKLFMEKMDREFKRDHSGSWEAPLPFRTPRQPLPNNKKQALQRMELFDKSLRKNPVKREHFLAFMDKIFENNHAEVAPPLCENEECWYLPLFGVYHPKKPNHIRNVFDSSAKFNGVSLDYILLSGPDLSNSLLGVLMQFEKW